MPQDTVITWHRLFCQIVARYYQTAHSFSRAAWVVGCLALIAHYLSRLWIQGRSALFPRLCMEQLRYICSPSELLLDHAGFGWTAGQDYVENHRSSFIDYVAFHMVGFSPWLHELRYVLFGMLLLLAVLICVCIVLLIMNEHLDVGMHGNVRDQSNMSDIGWHLFYRMLYYISSHQAVESLQCTYEVHSQ